MVSGFFSGGAADQFIKEGQLDVAQKRTDVAEQRLLDEAERQKRTEIINDLKRNEDRLLQFRKLESVQDPGIQQWLKTQSGIATLAKLEENVNKNAALLNRSSFSDVAGGVAKAASILPAAQAGAETTAQRRAAQPFDIAAEQRLEARTRAKEQRTPLTKFGKLAFDTRIVTDAFGEDSPQAKAVMDALESGDEEPKLTDVRGVRQEFTKLSSDFLAVQDGFAKIIAAPDTAGGDVATVINFMKMLDPGSVVREGEFATAASAAGLPDRIVQLARRVDTGERLTPNQRADFRNVALQTFKQQVEGQRLLEKTFTELARRQKMDPQNTVIPFIRPKLLESAPSDVASTENEQPKLPIINTTNEVESLESGARFIWGPTGQTLVKD